MTFRSTVLTLYPEMFPGPLGVSLAGRALADGLWSLETVQIRDSLAIPRPCIDVRGVALRVLAGHFGEVGRVDVGRVAVAGHPLPVDEVVVLHDQRFLSLRHTS